MDPRLERTQPGSDPDPHPEDVEFTPFMSRLTNRPGGTIRELKDLGD
jgi:hypothetical protein